MLKTARVVEGYSSFRDAADGEAGWRRPGTSGCSSHLEIPGSRSAVAARAQE
jgi:hypothetical protein